MANTATPVQVTYLQLISKDEKEQKVEGLKIKAQEANLEVSRSIMNLKADIASKTSQLLAVQRQIPYSVSTEYAVTKELTELNAKLAFAEEIKATRFADAQI